MMNENFLSVIHTDKTEPFRIVKPLNGTLRQNPHHLSIIFAFSGNYSMPAGMATPSIFAK
jgi:hypothetical protein